MSNLGSLVVKLVLDNLAKYKADLAEVGKEHQDVAAKIDTANNRAGTSTATLGEKMDAMKQVAGGARGDLLGAAQGAQALSAGAGMAAIGAGVLVAALGAAALAAHQGAQEQSAYDKALILTGNAAGTNASQMNAMAESIGNVVGTQGKAAAALTQMAGTGLVAAGNLQKFSLVAVEMERTVGTSVADTVKVFASLGADPVKASLRLNEATNYLTSSTFAQIKAAEELGDKTLAASLAQNAYADASKTRTAAIEANLNVLGKAWRAVGELADVAWDKMLNLGRDVGLSKQLEQQKAALANAETLLAKGGLGQGQAQQLVDTLKQKLTVTQEAIRLEDRSSQFAADSVRSEKAKISWMQDGDRYLTKREKSEIAIKRIRAEGAAAGASELEIEKRIAAEREKAESKPKANPADGVFRSISERTAELRAELVSQQDLTGAQKAASKVLDDLRTGALKLNEAEKARMGVALQSLLTEDASNVARKAAVKLHEQNAKIIEKNTEAVSKADEARRRALDSEVQTNTKMRNEIALIGLTEEQRAAQLQSIEKETIARLELDLVMARNSEGRESEVSDLEREIVLRNQRIALISTKSEKEINAKRAEALTESISDGMLRGFRNGQSFADVAINEIKAQFGKTVLQPIIRPIVDAGNQMINDLMKGTFGTGGGGGGMFGDLAGLFGGNAAAAFSGTSLGASGFGSGLAYGNMDLGLSFDGGGYTGSGARSGGLDGKGGFLAMMHPQETVVDHAKGQSVGGTVSYVTNNKFGSDVSRAEVFAGLQQSRALARSDRVEDSRRRRF